LTQPLLALALALLQNLAKDFDTKYQIVALSLRLGLLYT
jgi:hypothetical protein